MKTKTSKQPKQSKPTVQLKDLKPGKDAKGGGKAYRDFSFTHTVDKATPVL